LSLSRKLGFIALLYVIEGFPMGVYQEIWPVYFRAHGVSLTEIGLYSGLYFAWSLKVFWSPLVDRFGEKRQWIAGAMATMASSLVALSWLPAGSTPLVWLAMATFCVASATQDIAIDAYTIGLVERGQEGPANSVRVAAYRVGFLLAGGGLLLLPSAIGWDGTFAMGAVLSGVLAASAFLCPRVDNPGRQERDANLWARWRDREGVLPVIAFVLLYRVGDRAMGAMVKPFWVDRGSTAHSGGWEARRSHRTSPTRRPPFRARPTSRSLPPRWWSRSAEAWHRRPSSLSSCGSATVAMPQSSTRCSQRSTPPLGR
jgi:PAT family beta-lactamase induction signal transducer AmpG